MAQATSRVDFRTIKAQVTMAHVLTHFGLMEELATSEQGISGVCPLCHQHGFRVDGAKNTFRCQSCGKRGSVLDFVAAHRNMTLPEAAVLLKDLMGEGTPPRREGSPEATANAPTRDPVIQEAQTLVTALHSKMAEVNQLVERLAALVGTAE